MGTQSGFRIPGAQNTIGGLVKQEAEGKQRQTVKRYGYQLSLDFNELDEARVRCQVLVVT